MLFGTMLMTEKTKGGYIGAHNTTGFIKLIEAKTFT